ncbi:NADPH:adrenodoxin oxidoreductase FprB, related [Neospora caninum Liverpool]|uniref:NADPH:adrenodoxin oxidoreductase FprB, related n=1 Tax=Neospora caninum (strain Liverpool) TaxID=572307 RepID=F0VGJ2_NEOCL|nr:NADPH:adrenodoxin oxidoreductase FprB, related [Neospora caninum Liverpool]CBZ52836.1 NADPH:adrenodoxin oxidoreductase FprB, related [Neospora caninum Liverpool]|eukprot:XP_003882868.1 NADPH:adrenodoxin oxidoreductase FprB, related [Neospora caninum Liverpool]
MTHLSVASAMNPSGIVAGPAYRAFCRGHRGRIPLGGFYCAKYLQKAEPNPERLRVDMLETLPSPYGLVRYGVAPDHPEVKHVTEDFDVVARHPGFRFFGNVTLGTDVSLEELRSLYDAVILAYGAAGDRPLRIPGSTELRGCLSAREFVGFYNAHPPSLKKALALLPELPPHGDAHRLGLRPPSACVVGNGNVALDAARLLVKAREKLRATDIHERALDWFTHAGIREVTVIGRRGWVQSSFSNKELRELVTDDTILAVIDPADFSASLTEASLEELRESRLKQRSRALFEQMAANWDERERTDRPIVHLRFLASPVRALPHPDDPSRIGALEVTRNRLEGSAGAQRAVPEERGATRQEDGREYGEETTVSADERMREDWASTARDTNTTKPNLPDRSTLPTFLSAASVASSSRSPPSVSSSSVLPASLLIWSIGFQAVHAPNLRLPTVPGTGALVNDGGRILGLESDDSGRTTQGGVYASGWVRRGPRGVIATNIMDARETADRVLADLHLAHSATGARAEPQLPSVTAPVSSATSRFLGDSSETGSRRGLAGEKAEADAGDESTQNGKIQRASQPAEEPNARPEEAHAALPSLEDLLRRRAVHPVTYQGWLRVKDEEKRRGQTRGKPAEKIACIDEMLAIAHGEPPTAGIQRRDDRPSL